MRAIAMFIAAALVVVACGNGKSSSSEPATSDSGTLPGTDDGGGAPRYEVDCTHPGAGDKLADGKCACDQSLVVFTGVWNGLYTCREGTACVDKDAPESFTFTQDGNHIYADDGKGFTFDGIVCRDYFVWSGGPTTKEYVECGTLHFLDANHYVKDSCYVYAGAGACDPGFAAGCPGQSGQCTNTGARSPETAPPITKVICSP